MKNSRFITVVLVILLILFTVAFLWKGVFYGDNVASIQFPLLMSYLSTNALFDGPLHINPELNTVMVTPSVSLWGYPPGIYTLINVAYNLFGFKVTNINIISLIFFMLAVVLAFFVFRKILNKFASFILSLFVLVFCAKIVVMPDFVVLLLSVSIFALLFYYYYRSEKQPSPLVLVFLGVLVGIVTFFKHNTGIPLFLALSSYIFFTSLQFEAGNEKKSGIGRILVPVIIAVHLVFGVLFFFQLKSIVNSVYYLLPFIIFFAAFIYYLAVKNREVSLKIREFFRNYAFFLGSFLIIVAIWFIWFGMSVGFSRYFSSLYGMYSGFTGVWDLGIFNLFTRTIDYQGFGSISAIAATVYSFFTACLIFLPLVIGIISAAVIAFHVLRNNLEKIKEYIGICILGVMGVFFLYPLESSNNLVSRLFPFIFILFYFVSKRKFFTNKVAAIFFSLVLVFMLPLIFNNVSDAVSASRSDYTPVSEKVDVKLPAELTGEINRATDLINTTTYGEKYYIIDSHFELFFYYYLTDVEQKVYFIEMRPGILDKKVAAEIVKTIEGYKYLVVSKEQYDTFINGISFNPELDELFDYIKNNYSIENTFIMNPEYDNAKLLDFYIMVQG